MKRIRLSVSLFAVGAAIAGVELSGCTSAHFVTASNLPPEPPSLFEDVMVTGSHIVYRLPTSKDVAPIHVPPKVSPLSPSSVDVVDVTGFRE